MIDVKGAVKIAFEYLDLLFSDISVHFPRLEEIEYNEEDHTWLVTLSFLQSTPSSKCVAEKIAELNSPRRLDERDYKLIRIDAENGKVLSMKIRQLV